MKWKIVLSNCEKKCAKKIKILNYITIDKSTLNFIIKRDHYVCQQQNKTKMIIKASLFHICQRVFCFVLFAYIRIY